MNHQTTGGDFTVVTGKFMFGREYTLKKGGLINRGFIFNVGVSDLMRTNVSYHLDGQDFYHEFTNSGTYGGLTFRYFFRPLKKNDKKHFMPNNSYYDVD